MFMLSWPVRERMSPRLYYSLLPLTLAAPRAFVLVVAAFLGAPAFLVAADLALAAGVLPVIAYKHGQPWCCLATESPDQPF